MDLLKELSFMSHNFIKNKYKNPKQIEFICPICKTKERIPRDVVEFLDASDQIGVDTNVPPRFNCQNCYGKMIPIHYVSVNGKIFTYNDRD